MKKIVASITVVLFFASVHAQDIESIKNQVIQSNFSIAKISIDKAITSSLAQNPEAWLLRSYIYIALYKQAAATTMANDDADLNEAVNAFAKYRSLEPGYHLLYQKMYNYVVSSLYFAMYDKGGKAFNISDWQEAYKTLSLAVDLGDIMIETKISEYKLDTAAILYAGYSAQYLKDYPNAVKYYKRLADKKISGKDNEFLYQFLSQYYTSVQRDEAGYKLYSGIGKSLYPSSNFFAEQDVEFERLKDPYSLAIQQGSDLIAELEPADGKELPKKTQDELESKMIVAFDKAAHIKAAKAGMAYTFTGNHYVMKSIGIGKKITDLQEKLKTAGGDAAAIINANLKDLFSDYDVSTNFAIRCFSDASEAFAKKNNFEADEKEAYKSDLKYLVQLHEYQKNVTANNDPKLSKWHNDEEKKWNDVLSKIN